MLILILQSAATLRESTLLRGLNLSLFYFIFVYFGCLNFDLDIH